MVVVDGNRLNLLKMKEKLLEITGNKNDKLVNEYKELVSSIDKDEYDALIKKIKETNYHNLPLEEQVTFLNEIESDYNSLNELQCGYKNTYSKYSDDELELSDIENILIENIVSRSSTIQGYLMNKKNLENNKIELERLNLELISTLKKQDLINNKVLEINKSIKNNLMSAEGRIINNHGDMVYTSIQDEFKNVNLDLKLLIENEELLQQELFNAEKEKKENNETLQAALICYKGDNKNEEIYNRIKSDAKLSEYKSVLMEILNQICTETYDYDLMLNKMYRILNLIEERKLYLKNNYYIDPFDRLKINEHLEFLNRMGNNSIEIANIRKTITYFTSLIDEMEKMNSEYLDNINRFIPILKEDEYLEEDINHKIILSEDNNIDDYKISFDYMNIDTKVIKIDDLSHNFMLDRVHEKTDGVIKRVNELFNHISSNKIKTPELIIDEIHEDNNLEKDKLDSFNDLTDNYQNNFIKEDEPIENTIDEVEKENHVNDKMAHVEEINPLEDNIKDEDNIFEEIVPFEETPLFSDRADSDVFDEEKKVPLFNNMKESIISNNVALTESNMNDEISNMNDEMPEAFWTTKEEDNKTTDSDLQIEQDISFDDQIKKLLKNDIDIKTKKR